MRANYLKFLYFICQIIEIIAQWSLSDSQLTSNNLFTAMTTTYYNLDTEYFYIPLTSYKSANFITCTSPSTSYITLNATYLQALQYYSNSQSGSLYYISFDLYFQGTWSGESVVYTQGSITYTFTYTSPTSYALSSNFCDNLAYEVQTVNFTSQVTTSEQYKFQSTNTGTGQVSIRNYLVSKPSCYYTCNECLGSQYNQCLQCYYGTVSNGICPNCPSSAPYYMKNLGCFTACSRGSLLYADGFCQSFSQYIFVSAYFINGSISYEENYRWNILFDQNNVDTSPQIFEISFEDYFGVFKYGAGIYRFVNEITQYNTQGSVLIYLQLIAYGPIPLNCGIQFKINSTYYASIYMNSSGLQLHNIKLYQKSSVSTYKTYTSNTRYDIYFLADIPLYPFGFSIIGNYTTGTSGWALDTFIVTTGVCSQYCQFCEVAFICKICKSGYYLYRDGTCVSCSSSSSSSSSLKTIVNSTYCQDLDDMTPYSKYLAKEYLGYAGDPNQYSQYTLLSQNGSNLLKGSTIYFSYWNSLRIFGGPYVWSQAKFVRKFTSLTPHHKITILFNIIFGPTFPLDGSFIYTLENNSPLTVTSSNYTTSYTDGSKMKSIKETFSHSLSTFNLYLECFGPNNEPISAFCGMSNLYVVIHECQPYCSVCTDQFTCQQWNSTYNAAIIKFSQSDCLSSEYFSKEKLRCFPCPSQCETCVSELSCLTCQPTFQKTILGCKCKQQQYELNNQCYDCPIECNQCLSDTFCFECLSSNYRKLVNNQCVCLDGYYSQPNNPVCQFCNKFCKTCNGPTFNDCLTCQPITNIQLVLNTCQCPTKTYFDGISYSCVSCHTSCLNCYSNTINSCLSCDSSLNRILKGLQCKCKPGYYDLNSVCTNCPIAEDITLQDCYRFCSPSNIVWHTTICNSCEQGFQLIQNECQPICGDLVIAGYEQCEDGNNVLNDKCYNCQFQCPLHCLTCNSDTIFPCPDVCGDGYITGVEECEDGNTIPYDGCYECKYSCQKECTNCVKGQCQECATLGWHLDPTVTPWQCKETCGDGIIVGTEQCEDGNNADDDGCKNCRYFCRIGCTECDYTTNKCLACQYTGFKPSSYYCVNICGDGLTVTDPYGYYSEECDDGNTTSYDGCSSSCYYQCQSSSVCTTCTLDKCTACSTGLVLNTALNKCITVCGDGIISALEQCEDSLSLPYRCQKCKTFCQPSCKTCGTIGQGCTSCADGYKKIDGLCYPICGDKKITVEEDCDDGNLIFDDGCHNCKFVCQNSCLDCYKGKCLNCMDGFELINFKCFPICGDGIINSLEQCEQMNPNDNCRQCQYVCPENCQQCLHGICLKCNDNYELNFINGNRRCDQITQIQQLVEYCEFQVNGYCNKCVENAYYDIFDNVCKPITQQYDLCEILLETNCKQCIQFCVECNSIHCIKCEQGYYLDQQFQCQPKCGDGLVLREEQCDDALKENEILQCFQCQIVCPDYCKVCTLGYCLECDKGYYLDFVSNTCNSQCGDMIVATNEVCDDGNEYRYDGCFKCQYQCQQQCLNCQFGKCYECEQPLKLINSEFICEEKRICLESEGLYYNDENNECFSVCGDGKKTDKEDCDDANEIPNDGCFKCKYQCIINCTNCQQGQCYECETGYELVGQYCKTICGDGLILENEQCDDGNQISRDGCSSCIIDAGYKCVDEDKGSFCYKCQDHCTECEKAKQNINCLKCEKGYFLQDNTCNQCSDKCEECEKTPNNCLVCSTENCETCKKSSGLYMDQIEKKCVTQCGDGIKAGEEACDDGNIIDKDGCNSVCQIEKEFNCDSNGCNLLEKKKIEFIYTNSTSTTDFNLLYDDVESDLCQNIKINIEQFQQHEFNFTVNKKTNQSEGTQMCDVKFNFFKTIMEHNLIHVKIPLISNAKRILIEEEREIVIVPRKVVFYDAAQQAQAESVASASTTFTFLLQLIGPLTILLGGFNFFWTILDILTWINNFYFINVDYPLNVKIFFSKLNWGDIISIPDIIVLNQPNDEYYFEAPTKFTEKDVNPLFMINIQLFISLVVLSVVAYFCSIAIIKIIISKYKKQLKPRQFEYYSVNQNQTIVVEECPPSPQKKLRLPRLIEKIYNEAQNFSQNFGSIFISVINLAFLDICLACTLQLVYVKNQDFTIIQVNIILAFIGIIFILVVFQLYSYVSQQHEILYENQKFQNLYQSLYEGINTKSQWARKYCFINLFRKALFIFCTVYFYEMPLLQTSTCCLTCFLNLAFIVFENPFQNRSLLIQTSLPDFCIFIIIFLTVILSVHDSSQILTFDEKMIIGWLILCLIGLSIFIQLIFLFQQLFSELKERFNQIRQLICQTKQLDIKKE